MRQSQQARSLLASDVNLHFQAIGVVLVATNNSVLSLPLLSSAGGPLDQRWLQTEVTWPAVPLLFQNKTELSQTNKKPWK